MCSYCVLLLLKKCFNRSVQDKNHNELPNYFLFWGCQDMQEVKKQMS